MTPNLILRQNQKTSSAENLPVARYNLSLAGRYGQGSREVSTETVPSMVRSSEAKHTGKNGIRKKKSRKKKKERGEEMKCEHRHLASKDSVSC